MSTYSTLKPEMSSASPVRLNGAWLTAARAEINHIMASG